MIFQNWNSSYFTNISLRLYIKEVIEDEKRFASSFILKEHSMNTFILQFIYWLSYDLYSIFAEFLVCTNQNYKFYTQ
jgi:hypothetical protein